MKTQKNCSAIVPSLVLSNYPDYTAVPSSDSRNQYFQSTFRTDLFAFISNQFISLKPWELYLYNGKCIEEF